MAWTFYNSDGQRLVKQSSGGVSLTGSTDNTITTVTGACAIQGEANLKFNGTYLTMGCVPTPDAYLHIRNTGANMLNLTNTSSCGKIWGVQSRTCGNFQINQESGGISVLTVSPAGAVTVPGKIINDGIVKAWAFASGWGGGGGQTLADSFNITSMSDDGTGLTTVTWADDFATADAYVNGGFSQEGRVISQLSNLSQATGSSQLVVYVSDSGSRTDADPIMIMAIGDQ